MVNLTLLLLLLHYAAFLIFKPKSNVLGCGIFAWSGKRHNAFNRSKFDILGILNETRGVDSCGYTMDGEIYTGVGTEKVYRDFIALNHRIVPKEIPVVIGHTRWSTVGATNASNAHPFGFGESGGKEKYAFIGVHNGTLLNHHELARNYGVPLSNKEANGTFRSKIDSELLLEIIYTSGNFKVLSEYNGAAALVFYNVSEPNVMYCYHGASKKFAYDKEISEERPLFFYRETKNSLYVSSLEESLHAIGGTEATVGSFEYNTIYKITNGDISKAEKIKISRLGRTQKTNFGSSTAVATTYSNPRTYDMWNYYDDEDWETDSNHTPKLPARKEDYNSGKKEVSGSEEAKEGEEINASVIINNIYQEPLLKSATQLKGRVVFNKLRYWKNGEMIQGFYTFIENYGFYKLGDTLTHAEVEFWCNTNKFFLRGEFVHNDENITDDDWGLVSIPFPNADRNPINNPPIYPFYDGIRLKTVYDYDSCIRMRKNGRQFDPVALSMCSEHPVIDVSYSLRDDKHQGILLDGELYDGSIAPLGSDRVYHIVKGNLISSHPVYKRDEPVEVKSIIDVVDDIVNTQQKEEDYTNNDLVEKEIQNAFMVPFDTFPKHKRTLEKFLPNAKAKAAIKIIDDFNTATYNLIEIEER